MHRFEDVSCSVPGSRFNAQHWGAGAAHGADAETLRNRRLLKGESLGARMTSTNLEAGAVPPPGGRNSTIGTIQEDQALEMQRRSSQVIYDVIEDSPGATTAHGRARLSFSSKVRAKKLLPLRWVQRVLAWSEGCRE